MDGTKIFFHSNIRLLREKKRFSQEEIAQVLDLSRNKLQALESGKTLNPAVADMIKFSNYFKVSVDSLLKVDLTKLGDRKLYDLMAGNDVYMMGGQLRVLAITVDRNNKENVEYVPIKAKAGYRSGYNDPEYIASLPRFSMPNLPRGKTYRIFPITGDSMLPVPDGADVTCSFIQDWTTLKAGSLCVVILKGEQDFVFKQVTVSNNELLLVSLNPVYKPYKVPVAEVLEIWAFHSYHTRELPEPPSDLQTMAGVLREIQEELKIIKAKR